MSKLSVAEAIQQTESRFLSVAPTSMNYEAEKGFAIQLLKNNAYLMKAAVESPASLQQSITNVAAIGLSLNPAEKLAYLLPRNVKVDRNRWETRIFLEPSYMGLVRLATNSGSIEWVQAASVYLSDEFTDNGPGERPTHQYNAFSKDRGEFVGVYCVAKTGSGDYLTTVMTSEEVLSIRDRSEAWKKGQYGPWKDDFSEMAKKSVVRRAFKMWPMTNERAAHAVDLSNVNEGFEPILTDPTGAGDYTAEQKEYFDQLISNGDDLAMWVFEQTLDNENLFSSLYHSFEKGTKGKNQQAIESLLKKGREKTDGMLADIEGALQANDAVAVSEIIEELTDDERNYIIGRLSPEAQSFAREVAA